MKIVTCLALSLAACSHQNLKPSAPPPATVAEAVANPLRSPENVARDAYRHPVQTLEFFGVGAGQKIVEIEPGKGLYTEILAPFALGNYVAVVNPKYSGATDWLKAHPEFKSSFVPFAADGTIPGVADQSADVVLTFRNVHNWVSAGTAAHAFASFARILKPGGVLGVVDHRAKAKGHLDPKSGYTREADVIKLAEAAGFRLDARSEINANPKDTTVHPNGVWSLPPSLKGGAVNRDALLAVGESDRMTLRFVKK